MSEDRNAPIETIVPSTLQMSEEEKQYVFSKLDQLFEEKHSCIKLFGVWICRGDWVVVYTTRGATFRGVVSDIEQQGLCIYNEGREVGVSFKAIRIVEVLSRGEVYKQRFSRPST